MGKPVLLKREREARLNSELKKKCDSSAAKYNHSVAKYDPCAVAYGPCATENLEAPKEEQADENRPLFPTRGAQKSEQTRRGWVVLIQHPRRTQQGFNFFAPPLATTPLEDLSKSRALSGQ